MALSWLSWAGIAAAAVAALVAWSWISYRRWVRDEFLEYVRARHPQIGIGRVTFTQADLRTPGGHEGTMSLQRLYSMVGQIPASDVAAREKAFEAVASMVLEADAAGRIDPERDRARLRPRIVRWDAVPTGGDDMPKVARGSFGVEGLNVVLVLDSAHSVAYVNDQALADLGLSFDAALDVAKRNLRPTTPADMVRHVLDRSNVSVMKTMDTYDAARLLLVPEYLGADEQVAAVIPDRDTLALAPVPKDGDWSNLEKLALANASEPLWQGPLIVSASGIAARR